MKRYLLFCLLAAVAGACGREETAPRESHQNPVYSKSISNNRINAIAEDAQGHIWLGTFRGLNKDAVHEYHQYFCAEDSLSIPDNQISALYRDSKDVLWVATVNGICRYTDKDNFVVIPSDAGSNYVSQFLEDRSGCLYTFANPYLGRYVPEEGRLEVVASVPVALNTKAYLSPSDEFWFVGGNRLLHYGRSAAQIRDTVTLDFYPSCSYMDNNGQIWLFDEGKVRLYDTNLRKFLPEAGVLEEHPMFRNVRVNQVYPYGNGSLLIGTENSGMFLYDGRNLVHQSESVFPFEVPDFRINTVFTDSKENIWFGSYDQGVAVHYNYKRRFNNDSYLCSAFENKSVVAVKCDFKGNMWINTLNDGLYLYESGTRRISRMDLQHIFPKIHDGHSVVLHIASDDDLWLASMNSLVRCEYSDRGGRILEKERYPAFFPISMTETADGTLWLGNYNGVLQYVKDGQVHFMDPLSDYFTFVSALLPMGGQVLAGAFSMGLYTADSRSGSIDSAGIPDEDWNACISRSVFIPSCLFRDSDDVVWVGTVANGLMRYDIGSNSLSSVEGAPCTDICSIEEDVHGNLWVSTQYGLGKYDKVAGKFINWFDVDGIGGNQFYDRSSCRMPDGTLVFGGTHGLTMFNPNDITEKRDVKVIFEKLRVHNVPEFPGEGSSIDKAVSFNPSVVMDSRQNSFSIAFSALEYGEYERVHYFYRMEGFDGAWIDAGDNREANYANLSPGRYQFKVRVTNNDQSVVEGENVLDIIVKPSLWLSWWAILIYVLLLIAAVSVFVVVRLQMAAEKRAKQKALFEKEQERRVNRMNMSFFANISHEFRAPLTMISGPVSSLRQSANISDEDSRLLDIVQRNINRMLRLVNQLLDFNKLENDSLKLTVRKTDVIAPLRNLADIFRVTAEEKCVTFLTYGMEDSLTAYVDVDKLDKICFNLLSNAMKFTSAKGKVELSLDVLTRSGVQYLKVAVKDNGPGIPEDELEKVFERYYQLENQTRGSYNWGTGIGLYFAKTLAEIHHGFLTAENRTDIPSGAMFTLLLPMEEQSYLPSEIAGEDDGAAQFVSAPVKYVPAATKADEDKQKTIVVVDDDMDVTYYLKELLSPYYNVVCKFEADGAFTAVKEVSPDIIVSDVSMPGKTGYDLCRQIKSELQLSHIPVVLLTAKAMVEDQIEGLDCGADAYVTKPFDPQYLLSLLGSLLTNREKLRALLGENTTADNLQNDTLSPQDKSFISDLYALMEKELSNSELDIATMTRMLHISRSKFYYKVKGLTGENPAAFFKLYKLNRAMELLKEGKYNISEVADITGFSSLSHFSTAFKKHFGKSPSEIR